MTRKRFVATAAAGLGGLLAVATCVACGARGTGRRAGRRAARRTVRRHERRK